MLCSRSRDPDGQKLMFMLQLKEIKLKYPITALVSWAKRRTKREKTKDLEEEGRRDMEGICMGERNKCWTGGDRQNKKCRETERDKKRIRERGSPAAIWVCICFALQLHMSNGLDLLYTPRALSLPFLFAPQFPAERSVFFHCALGDDSLGLLRFTLGRIRAGSLLIIFHRLSSFVC